jgi:MoaD family protein
MRVRVKFFAFFRELFGGAEREVELERPADVRALLAAVCDSAERRRHVFEGEGLKPGVVVMRNGLALSSARDLGSPVEEGDTVAVFPFPGGG